MLFAGPHESHAPRARAASHAPQGWHVRKPCNASRGTNCNARRYTAPNANIHPGEPRDTIAARSDGLLNTCMCGAARPRQLRVGPRTWPAMIGRAGRGPK